MEFSFFITTLGCLKNEADSRQIHKSMILNGFKQAKSIKESDFHIINTCGFIEEAKKETIEVIFDSISLKKDITNKNQKLIVVGCFAQRYKEEIQKEIAEVDLIIGTGEYHRVGDIIKKNFEVPVFSKKTSTNFYYDISKQKKFYLPIKISEGCNRNCSFCAIPSFKGKFGYREKAEILQEIQEVLKINSNIKEICIVSQDTNSYGKNIEEFISLLEDIELLPEIHWIRILYLYPDLKTKKILEKIHKKKFKKIVPYLESPVQHVSESILKKMNRFGSYTFFVDLFTYARELFPNLEIRTSFLVGFPGETIRDVELIQKFIEECQIEHITFFPYSREEGTASYHYLNQVKKKEIYYRVNQLQNFYEEQLKQITSKHIHKTFNCLLENITSGQMVFRRPQSAPEIDDNVLVELKYKDFYEKKIPLPKLGNFYDVTITGFATYDYIGELSLNSKLHTYAKI